MIHRHLTIACVGEANVGKNSLIRCLAKAGGPVEDGEAIVVDKETIEFAVDSTFTSVVSIKNTSGKETLESIRKEAMCEVDGVLACFSVVDSSTLDALIKKWIPEVRALAGSDVPILLVGTKADLRDTASASPVDKRSSTKKQVAVVQTREGESVAKKMKVAGYYECSAHKGDGANPAFIAILQVASMYKVKNERDTQTRGSSGSSPGSPKPGRLSRFLPGSRSSMKQRLSQRLVEVASSGETAEALDLISKGAHVSWSSTETKVSPLHAAARAGKVDVVNVLLYAGANLTLKDSNGATALHVACANGHFDCAKALLDKGAEVNSRNLIDSTPLHEAAGRGSRELVSLLLARGADVTLKDVSGRTARERADIAGAPLLFDSIANKASDHASAE